MGILQLLAKENYIAYSKPLAQKIGIDEAILFGELCSMCNLYGDVEFFCEQQRLCDDTCLTEYRVRNALKHLCEQGLVSVVKKGLPAKNYYTLSEERFLELMGCQSTSGAKFDTTTSKKSEPASGAKFDTTFNNNQSNKKQNNKNQSNNIYTEFETLWKSYPRKLGKPKALKAYEKARKNGVTYEQVERGLNNYLAQIKAQKTETEFIKHGSTWFNGECWNDEYETGGSNNGTNGGNPATTERPSWSGDWF